MNGPQGLVAVSPSVHVGINKMPGHSVHSDISKPLTHTMPCMYNPTVVHEQKKASICSLKLVTMNCSQVKKTSLRTKSTNEHYI